MLSGYIIEKIDILRNLIMALLSSNYHAKFKNSLCNTIEEMDIWVAVLPRVDQLTKVMPNIWRAV